MKRTSAILFFSVCFLSPLLIFAQSLPVGSIGFDDYYRRQQLLGKVDSSISFTIRPLNTSSLDQENLFFPDSNVGRKISPRGVKFYLLPLSWQNTYTSHHPYGWNDGLMIPAKGYQTMASAGVFAKYGPLSIQLRPEFVFAANSDFIDRRTYYGNADIPERFGAGPYSKFSWGQSAIRLTFNPVSIGFSNENLWWGPGIRSSLLMSNNAPGFRHVTINTSRPLRTPIGNFEAQFLGGRLESSGFTPASKDEWRYLASMVVSYNPKWVSGLFLGLTRSFQKYGKDIDRFGDYFPFLTAFQKVNDTENASGSDDKDQLTSVFARWAFTEAAGEVYFEYGLNDHSYDTRDFLMSPEHSRAYLIGARKLLPFRGRADENIQVSFELTHMSQSIDRVVRPAGEWYVHSVILQGYTNKGQVLGAGIGPGGNLQSLDVSWYKGLKRIGLQLERFEHNADLYDALYFAKLGGEWIDFSIAGNSEWTYKDFLFNAKLQGIQSINYQWNSGINGSPKENVFNLNVQLGLTYRF